ncbi:MAG: hypothetical protein WBH63_05755 [Bacillota bacterium]
MTGESVSIGAIAWIFVMSCVLAACIHMLPVSAELYINNTSRLQFPGQTELSQADLCTGSLIQDATDMPVCLNPTMKLSKHGNAVNGANKGNALNDKEVKAGLDEEDSLSQSYPGATIRRKPRDAQLTIEATAITENILVREDEFQVAEGEMVIWEVELTTYNMRAPTGWRYWEVSLEFGPELLVEVLDELETIDPIPEGGSPTRPTLTIMRDENTRKTKVMWSWHSLEDDTPSDFPKRATAVARLRVSSSEESGFNKGRYAFCDNASIRYMTGAKRPTERTCELEPIMMNVIS